MVDGVWVAGVIKTTSITSCSPDRNCLHCLRVFVAPAALHNHSYDRHHSPRITMQTLSIRHLPDGSCIHRAYVEQTRACVCVCVIWDVEMRPAPFIECDSNNREHSFQP